MGDADDRDSKLTTETADLRSSVEPLARVEIRERIVEQEDGRPLADDGPADGDMLGLAGGEVARASRQQVAERLSGVWDKLPSGLIGG